MVELIKPLKGKAAYNMRVKNGIQTSHRHNNWYTLRMHRNASNDNTAVAVGSIDSVELDHGTPFCTGQMQHVLHAKWHVEHLFE